MNKIKELVSKKKLKKKKKIKSKICIIRLCRQSICSICSVCNRSVSNDCIVSNFSSDVSIVSNVNIVGDISIVRGVGSVNNSSVSSLCNHKRM